jgi:hypothetical protein
MSEVLPQKPMNVNGTHPFPLLHELAELPGHWEPDNGMHVVGHHHKADARRRMANELIVEHPEDDSLGLIVVQETPTPVA